MRVENVKHAKVELHTLFETSKQIKQKVHKETRPLCVVPFVYMQTFE